MKIAHPMFTDKWKLTDYLKYRAYIHTLIYKHIQEQPEYSIKRRLYIIGLMQLDIKYHTDRLISCY